MTMPERSTDDLARCCQDERSVFRTARERHSPCCAELFRRSFAGDWDARMHVESIFHLMLCKWIQRFGTLDSDTFDSVVQRSWEGLYKGGPRRPALTATDDLSRIFAYLKVCARNAVFTALRAQKRLEFEVSLDDSVPAPPVGTSDFIIDVLRRVDEIGLTPEERLLFNLCFLQGYKPQEIAQRFPALFPEVKQIYWAIQTIRRRLRKDPIIRDLCGLPPDNANDQENPADSSESKPDHPSHGGGSSRTSKRRQRPRGPASLEIQAADAHHGEEPMEPPCTLDDDILMDYNAGLLSEEQRAAVEANPACVARARRIAAELARIEAMLYRLTCPDVDTLIAYHDRQLESTNMLVIRRHVEQCDRCREELDLLAAMDATPFEEPGLLARARRVIEAAFQPALALQLRGQAHVYAAPHVTLTLSMRRIDGGALRWTLVGELSTPDGAPFEQPVEQVVASRESAPDVRAEVDADGMFIIRDLPAGEYRLTVITPDEEIVIRSLRIGLSDEDS